MSRHSKNCTSQSIFTYGQKQKLKGQYGTKQQRVSQDSIKKFEMCTICNSLFTEPVCCTQGHVFCRKCAIQFIVKQKKLIASKRQELQLSKNKKQLQKQYQQVEENAKKIAQFQKYDNFQQISNRKDFVVAQKKQQNDQQKISANQSKPVGIYQITQRKQKYVKSSFWAAQNTTQVEENYNSVEISNKIKCPGGKNHNLVLKKLRALVVNKLGQQFCCGICNKQIRRQRIGSYNCGHVVCFSCKSNKCQLCQKSEGWIQIQSSRSAFSQHNKAEIKTYSHAFYI